MYKVNLFSKLVIKIEINNVTNRMSSFTFISFINKNDLKGEGEGVNFLIVK